MRCLKILKGVGLWAAIKKNSAQFNKISTFASF